MWRRGFTFIELILVVLILAALVGISVPRFKKTFDNLQLNNFASELQGQLAYWQERAIVEKKPITLKIDSEKKEYSLYITGAEAALKSYTVPSGITLQAEPAEITFYPDGSIKHGDAGKTNISLSNPGEEKITLTTEGVFSGFKIAAEEK